MPAERHVDPEILQALDATYEELRAEELELLPMPEENERLRARLERLQHGREELRSVLRSGQSGLEPHLPRTLETPFNVQSSLSEARLVRDALALVVPGAILLLLQWAYSGPDVGMVFFWIAALSAIRLVLGWHRNRWWAFQEESIEAWPAPDWRSPSRVPYSQVFNAEVRATPAQQRRGVGSLVVKYRIGPGAAEQSIQLDNIPEPERLAKWILSRSSSAKLTDRK